MTPRIRRSFTRRARTRVLARALRKKIKATGARQVRLYKGWFYTYPYPAPRGYGTRGELIGIYDATATVKWIEADLMRALLSLASCAQADERL